MDHQPECLHGPRSDFDIIQIKERRLRPCSGDTARGVVRLLVYQMAVSVRHQGGLASYYSLGLRVFATRLHLDAVLHKVPSETIPFVAGDLNAYHYPSIPRRFR